MPDGWNISILINNLCTLSNIGFANERPLSPSAILRKFNMGNFLHIATLILGVFFLTAVGLDTFQTIILPRRPSGRLRITRLFFIATWTPWSSLTRRVKTKNLREDVYGIYGPLSLILLLALWAGLLMLGFALLYFSIGSPFQDMTRAPAINAWQHLRSDLYVSGTTLFTLGLGDVLPRSVFARVLIIAESGVGLGFVALVIGYLPVLYQAFSKREVSIALLDGRAGSPPDRWRAAATPRLRWRRRGHRSSACRVGAMGR